MADEVINIAPRYHVDGTLKPPTQYVPTAAPQPTKGETISDWLSDNSRLIVALFVVLITMLLFYVWWTKESPPDPAAASKGQQPAAPPDPNSGVATTAGQPSAAPSGQQPAAAGQGVAQQQPYPAQQQQYPAQQQQGVAQQQQYPAQQQQQYPQQPPAAYQGQQGVGPGQQAPIAIHLAPQTAYNPQEGRPVPQQQATYHELLAEAQQAQQSGDVVIDVTEDPAYGDEGQVPQEAAQMTPQPPAEMPRPSCTKCDAILTTGKRCNRMVLSGTRCKSHVTKG